MKKLILIFFVFIQSCSNDEFVTVIFPVTNECMETTLQKLDDIIADEINDQFKIIYHEFDFKLDSHKEISGYIELSSKLDSSKKDIEGLFNSAVYDCHLDAYAEMELDYLPTYLSQENIENAYVKISDGHVKFYHGNSRALTKHSTATR